MATEKKNNLVSWNKHHIDCNGSPVMVTNFPDVYGTNIAISMFSPKSLLNIEGCFFDDDGKTLARPFIFGKGGVYNNGRYAVKPNSKADTQLWLMSCYEGDCVDWSANTAFFNKGKLTGIYSFRSRDKEKVEFAGDKYNLKEIYQFEFENCLASEGQKDIFNRFIGLLKADSPNGKGLHNSYRESIKEIL